RGGETRMFLTNKNRFFDKNGTKYLIGISHDITNRKNSEKELIKLSRAIEQSPVSIFITNLEGDIEYANPKVTAITGYKKSEIIGQNPRMFSSGEKSKEGYAALWKTINAGNEWFGEFHNKKKNGELFWEYASISPIKDTDGKITHYLAVKEDITKQKELINDLEEIKTKALEGQKSYKALFETIGDAIYIQDYDANFINVNSGVLSMYGYSKEELIGNTPIFLSAPDMNDMSAVFESFDKVKQGIPQVFEFWGKRKNGEIFPKTVSQYKGTYFGQDVVITVARDITERKQAEDALKESEREFRQLSESMPQIVWVTRADGWNIYFNQQWVDYTGLSLEESYGHGWNKPFHPDDQQLAWDAWHNAVTKKVIYSIESRLRQNDGTYQWWLVRGVPILDENNKIIKWFGTCTNIDEIKIAEIELINAKNKAEESDRLKSAFLANMSHEIRTPMNGILGFADFLKTPNLSDEKQQKYLMVIERSGKRMLNIIDDIISISKIESGVMEVNLEASNVNEQMEYIYTFFKPEVDAKGINFSYKNSLPLKEAIVKTDREKLFAILTNLVKNAIKYTDKGSIAFGYYKKDNFLQFYVKDSGIGVPKDRQEAIFERFIQADISDKMAKQGAGLGLSITKAYVEMLGGKLWLASEEGKGSVFYFTLPYQNGIITEEIVKIEVLSPIEISSTKKLKILVVDDDEASELLISIAIKEFADEIIVARNGIEAVEACRTNPDIDLILMDIQMPEMNGYEATKQIQSLTPMCLLLRKRLML
ncbi:MAG: PAS domain S-box protein, partial [Gelidibacter sp.]|nr:PAS domain S-box protein [Gelidibacter sp.]